MSSLDLLNPIHLSWKKSNTKGEGHDVSKGWETDVVVFSGITSKAWLAGYLIHIIYTGSNHVQKKIMICILYLPYKEEITV